MTGSSAISPERARAIRLVLLDVDGVLTDAGVYMGRVSEGKGTGRGRGIELKRFDIQDGLGIKILMSAGVRVAIVSGRYSPATVERARELGIRDCIQIRDARKLPKVRTLLAAKGVSWDEVAMVADDLPDLAVFREVGLRAAVGNAVSEIREIAHWVAERRGGHGAVREFCEALLRARGEWDELVEEYVRARS